MADSHEFSDAYLLRELEIAAELNTAYHEGLYDIDPRVTRRYSVHQ